MAQMIGISRITPYVSQEKKGNFPDFQRKNVCKLKDLTCRTNKGISGLKSAPKSKVTSNLFFPWKIINRVWSSENLVMYNSLQPYGPSSVRLLCLRDSPDRNTGVGCHFLQGIFLTQGLNLGLLHCRQILYHMSHLGKPALLDIVSQILPWHFLDMKNHEVRSYNRLIGMSASPSDMEVQRRGLETVF